MKKIHRYFIFLAAVFSLVGTGFAETSHVTIPTVQGNIELLSASEELEAQLSVTALGIFQKAEAIYPDLFGNPSEFRTTQGYIYKFYALQNTYIGMRDNMVYVLGGPFGDSIVSQGTVADTLAFLVDVENIHLSAVLDPVFANAWQQQISNLQLEGTGQVSRILADDITGSAHQRFVVRLRSGQTLLIAHNIDLAPRVAAIKVGDEVAFFGEYKWSEEGGVMHWTHHDPDGTHIGGWVKYQGLTYQ
jgi:hypothetical protein